MQERNSPAESNEVPAWFSQVFPIKSQPGIAQVTAGWNQFGTLFAYQLAVTVDDAFQGITAVVRGADLLASTPRQIALQERLGVAVPAYAHLPVAANARGEKWSKQTRAPALDSRSAARNLHAALAFLGQSPPAALAQMAVADVWAWALSDWSLARVPAQQLIAAPAVIR